MINLALIKRVKLISASYLTPVGRLYIAYVAESTGRGIKGIGQTLYEPQKRLELNEDQPNRDMPLPAYPEELCKAFIKEHGFVIDQRFGV